MNASQKAIKYLAMAFAIFLAFSILSAIVGGVMFVLNLSSDSKEEKTVEFSSIDEFDDEIKSVDIEGYIYTIEIKEGERFQVDLDNVSENYKSEVSDGTLKLSHDGSPWNFSSWFNHKKSWSDKSRITVTIPYEFKAEDFTIDAGVGKLIINGVTASSLDLNVGAGSIEGSDIMATDNVNVQCGTGDIELKNVTFHDMDLDTGVGNGDISGNITGDSSIDGGVGNLDLILFGNSDDYQLDVDAGLGDISINGKKYSDSNWDNDQADHSLDIQGGVGNITLVFEQQ